nr:MAG TPA: DNA-binding domain protein [Caudoviricetes sp.]
MHKNVPLFLCSFAWFYKCKDTQTQDTPKAIISSTF